MVKVYKIWSQSSELKSGPAQVRFASSLGFFFTTYSCFCLQALTHAWHDSRHTRFLPTHGRYSLPQGTAGKTLASDAASCAATLIHPPLLLPLPSHLTLQSEGGVGNHGSFSLPLPTSPHGVRFGWGTMSLVCMLTLGIWDARMFYQESHLYSVLKLLYLKGD